MASITSSIYGGEAMVVRRVLDLRYHLVVVFIVAATIGGGAAALLRSSFKDSCDRRYEVLGTHCGAGREHWAMADCVNPSSCFLFSGAKVGAAAGTGDGGPCSMLNIDSNDRGPRRHPGAGAPHRVPGHRHGVPPGPAPGDAVHPGGRGVQGGTGASTRAIQAPGAQPRRGPNGALRLAGRPGAHRRLHITSHGLVVEGGTDSLPDPDPGRCLRFVVGPTSCRVGPATCGVHTLPSFRRQADSGQLKSKEHRGLPCGSGWPSVIQHMVDPGGLQLALISCSGDHIFWSCNACRHSSWKVQIHLWSGHVTCPPQGLMHSPAVLSVLPRIQRKPTAPRVPWSRRDWRVWLHRPCLPAPSAGVHHGDVFFKQEASLSSRVVPQRHIFYYMAVTLGFSKQPPVMLLSSSILLWFWLVDSASTWDPGLSFIFVLRRRIQQHPSVAGVLLQCWLIRPNFNLRFARSIHPGACACDAPAGLHQWTRLRHRHRLSYLSFQLQDLDAYVIWFSSENLHVIRLL